VLCYLAVRLRVRSGLDDSLDAMTEREIDALLLHEKGEYTAGERLGESWNRMLMDLVHTPAEIMARAVRDHLADCLATLPALAEEGDAASLHFYLGNLTNMRKEIFPGLGRAYDEWLFSGDTEPLAVIANLGVEHWERLAREMMDLHRIHGSESAKAVERLIVGSYL